MNKPVPKASEQDGFIVQPPATMSVEATPRIVLFKADGTPLKRPIGYKP